MKEAGVPESINTKPNKTADETRVYERRQTWSPKIEVVYRPRSLRPVQRAL